MKTIPKTIHFAHRTVGLLTALVAVVGLTTTAPAHEAPCPLCGQNITQDTKEQDNEVVLKSGRKRIEYKCVYCALSEAHSDYKGDVTILAPSEKKGEPVKIERKDGKWAVLPETAYFVSSEKMKHKVCQEQARAFTTKSSAETYAKKHGVKVLTLAQMVESAKSDGGKK